MVVPWKESYDQPRQHIKKQRHYFANKGPYSQNYGFSSSHVWIWESICYKVLIRILSHYIFVVAVFFQEISWSLQYIPRILWLLFLRCSPSLHLYFPWRFLIPLTTIRHSSHPVSFMAFLIIVPMDILGFSGGASGKELSCQCRRCWRCRFNLWVGKIPCRREWLPTSVFLPGEFHGQSSLAGYSPRGHKELDTTDRLTDTHIQKQLSNILFSVYLPLAMKFKDGFSLDEKLWQI